ncbi:MAG: class I SAM-dependent methyltransferase [Verrucomicrobiota bacterium]|nr:class I SAM-dependent methyltransferase [Verrucomicrobiota bacterium]
MEHDYVLGTHDEELARLGLQHRVWRASVLECWRHAGITVGSRVLDVGAGPGYATADLAEMVGASGRVVALERSEKFLDFGRAHCRPFPQVEFRQTDVMLDDFPTEGFDFSWARWIACFVSDPARLIRKIADALSPGGIAVFHEYAAYQTWRYLPARPYQTQFLDKVMESWRAEGGEPDIALALPQLLHVCGMSVRSATPHIFCVRPNDYAWQWPKEFLATHPARLRELGMVDDAFTEEIRAEAAAAESAPESFVLTPLVLEIVAEKKR